MLYIIYMYMGFPGGSEGKASAHNAGDLGSIPGLGRSPGEGNGNPTPVHIYTHTHTHTHTHIKWASLMAQLVKNQSAM